MNEGRPRTRKSSWQTFLRELIEDPARLTPLASCLLDPDVVETSRLVPHATSLVVHAITLKRPAFRIEHSRCRRLPAPKVQDRTDRRPEVTGDGYEADNTASVR